LKGFTRTGAPLDGGWWALSENDVFAAVEDYAVRLDQRSGAIMDRLRVPGSAQQGGATDWGWLAVEDGVLLGSAARPDAARREQSRAVIESQYDDHQPLAVSQSVFALDPVTKETKWVHHASAIPNTSFAVDRGLVFFLEGVDAPRDTGRLLGPTLCANGIDVVALDLASGIEKWRTPIDQPKIDHSVFLAVGGGAVVVTSSFDHDGQIRYRVAAFDAATGIPRWRQEHDNNRRGTDGHHGEVVHHPVILKNVVVAEPMVYDLKTGEPVDRTGKGAYAVGGRSGCGTITASEDCLFFRDGNPSMIELREGSGESVKLTQSNRPGCWINIIPAQGLILMPESSAGCVCGFSLQTSMALVPSRP
jgi:outer membrane protein assembly factor BamB